MKHNIKSYIILVMAMTLNAIGADTNGTIQQKITPSSQFSREAFVLESAALWRNKLGVTNSAGGEGSVTSILTGFGLTGGPITNGGTIIANSNVLATTELVTNIFNSITGSVQLLTTNNTISVTNTVQLTNVLVIVVDHARTNTWANNGNPQGVPGWTATGTQTNYSIFSFVADGSLYTLAYFSHMLMIQGSGTFDASYEAGIAYTIDGGEVVTNKLYYFNSSGFTYFLNGNSSLPYGGDEIHSWGESYPEYVVHNDFTFKPASGSTVYITNTYSNSLDGGENESTNLARYVVYKRGNVEASGVINVTNEITVQVIGSGIGGSFPSGILTNNYSLPVVFGSSLDVGTARMVDAAGKVSAVSGFSGNGSSLTALTASSITPGGILPSLNGVNLTGIPISGLASSGGSAGQVATISGSSVVWSTPASPSVNAATVVAIMATNNSATATTANAVTASVTNAWQNYTLAASNSITAAMTNQNTGTSNGLFAHIVAATNGLGGSGVDSATVVAIMATNNAATATTASNVVASMTNQFYLVSTQAAYTASMPIAEQVDRLRPPWPMKKIFRNRTEWLLASNAFAFPTGPLTGMTSYAPGGDPYGSGAGEYLRDWIFAPIAVPEYFSGSDLSNHIKLHSLSTNAAGMINDSTAANLYSFDTQFWFAHLLWLHYKKTGDIQMFTNYQANASNAMRNVYVSNSLVYVTGTNGFFDASGHQSHEIFNSALRYMVHREFGEMCAAAGQYINSSNYLAELPRIRASADTNLWDGSYGLYYNTSSASNKWHSVFGSVFAVVTDMASPERADTISQVLIEGAPGGTNYAAKTLWRYGAIYNFPYDEIPFPNLTEGYQVGGLWPGFCGWAWEVVARRNESKALELVAEFNSKLLGGKPLWQYEWFGYDDSLIGADQYLWSAAGPAMFGREWQIPESIPRLYQSNLYLGTFSGSGALTNPTFAGTVVNAATDTRFIANKNTNTYAPGILISYSDQAVGTLRYANPDPDFGDEFLVIDGGNQWVQAINNGIFSVNQTNIFASGGSSINAVGITNGNVTIPGTLSVSGTTTAGTIAATSVSGNGVGITNAVDLIAGSNITITTNANKRSFTIDSTGGGSPATTNTLYMVHGSGTGTTNTWRLIGNDSSVSMDFLQTSGGAPSGYDFGSVFNTDGNFTWPGWIVATGSIVAPYFHGDGNGISNINAANISGNLVVETLTVATQYVTDAIIGNGSGVTNLNASNLASGTVPVARLGSGTANSSTYLRGDNTWDTPAGGSGIATLNGTGTNTVIYAVNSNALRIASTNTFAGTHWLTMDGSANNYTNSMIYLSQGGTNNLGQGTAGSMIDIYKQLYPNTTNGVGGEGITIQFNTNCTGYAIEISHKGSGAGILVTKQLGTGIQVDSASTGKGVLVSKTGTANVGIEISQSTAQAGLYSYVFGVGGYAALFEDLVNNNTAGRNVYIRSRRDGSTGHALEIEKQPATTATAGSALKINTGVNATGVGLDVDHRGTGSALRIYNNTTDIFRVTTNSVEVANTIAATNGYYMPSNSLAIWPTAPRSPGEAYWGNSNGTIYLLQSGMGNTWISTNKIGL